MGDVQLVARDNIYVGISLMPEQDILEAAEPLFESDDIEILEWNFDMGWGSTPLPYRCSSLLDRYSYADRLIGHGVSFSLLSGQWSPRQEWWLEQLKEEVNIRKYRHISEHFGFMTAGNFHRSAPLPVPLTSATLSLGQSRIRQLADICGIPVGLENLALAFGPKDVAEQGVFLKHLISVVDGFLLLDLHNIYCQLCNFDVDPIELLESYPLDKVKEIHISGGSWSHPPSSLNKAIRRDTHDHAVPEEIFELLQLALPRCPHVEAIIFERIGNTILNNADAEHYREDFFRIKSLVKDPENRLKIDALCLKKIIS